MKLWPISLIFSTIYPASLVAYTEGGKRFGERGDRKKAKEYLRCALRLANNLRMVRLPEGSIDCDAISLALDRVERGQLETSDAFNVLAVEAAKSGEINHAITLLKRCEQSEQTDETAYQCGVICERNGNLGAAIAFYKYGGWDDESFAVQVRVEGHLDMAEWHEVHGQINDAVDALDEEGELDIRALKRLVVLHTETGNLSTAFQLAQDVVAANPGDSALLRLQDYVRARMSPASAFPRQK